MLEQEGLADCVCEHLNLNNPKPDLTEWTEMINRQKAAKKNVTIGLVGKYVALPDAYLSVAEALRHGGIVNDANVNIEWIDSEKITEENVAEVLKNCDGVIVPGGFGDRGIEGMIESIRYARENKIPMFGICLGMQMAVVEFARNVAGLKGANSTEFAPDGPYSVIDIMEDQKDITDKGGTMRLGAYPCVIKPDSLNAKAYGQHEISERHRHRYEFNNDFREEIENAGMKITGTSPNGLLVEAVEVPDNRFFVAVQYHPEFKSRPNRAHPLFREFIKASLEK